MKRKKTKETFQEPQKELIYSQETSLSPIGTLLKRRREEKKISPEEAAQYLCIRFAFLKAIEEGDYKKLPERVYTLGFVSSYARYLDLDSDAIVQEYLKEYKIEDDSEPLILPVDVPQKGAPPYKSYVIGLLILTATLSLWFYMSPTQLERDESLPALETKKTSDSNILSSLQDEETDTQDVLSPSFQKTSDASSETLNTASQETSSSEPQIASSSPLSSPPIQLKAREPVWIQITDSSGHPIFTKVMNPHESYDVDTTSSRFLTVGNAGGLDVTVGDKKIGSLGKQGQVLREIPLDAASLLAINPT